MRSFYEKIEEAKQAKTPAEAIGKLTEAYAIGRPLLDRARARCEHRTVVDISNLLRWAAAECAHRHVGGELPAFWLFFGGGCSCGLGGGYRRPRSSLEYRWGERAELAESWLPTVPLWTRGPQLEG